MRMNRSAVLLSLFLASACNQRTDQPVPPTGEPRQDPVSVTREAPASSIMRPEVADEVTA